MGRVYKPKGSKSTGATMGERSGINVDTPWMSYPQAASYLGIRIGTLRNWVSARYVPFARRGRVVRPHREKLGRWLRHGECHGRKTIADTRPAHVDPKNTDAREEGAAS